MLLHWCTLEPAGSSNLAAIRFTSPVRIHSISIFPTDDKPFTQDPNIISRTEPETFFLELYFNAQPVAQPNAKERPKPSNALIPTIIAYAGGRMEFAVNMSPELSTRLMIVKGAFESVSMAIYGDVVNELPPPKTTYEPRSLPTLDMIPLSPALDPANARDPTTLACQLLDLIPDAPSLPLVIRLMFCLKPSNDDWDSPDFPYLFTDLSQLPDDPTIDEVYRLTSRPVHDDTSSQAFADLADKVIQCLGPPDSQSYYVAGLLSHAACQHPSMATALIENLDISYILEPPTLDESTLELLRDAVSNPDVARNFNDPNFKEFLTSMSQNVAYDRRIRTLVQQLLDRIEGMAVLEDAISNTQGDFVGAAAALKDIACQEMSTGTLLESLVAHPDLVDKLAENPALAGFPPTLFVKGSMLISHDEFIAFLRAFVGVGCVLAVYAWADSLPDERCRERCLSILRLWQGVDGYREILDHLLLLRQMVFRLNCMLDGDAPTRAGVDSETILLQLCKAPRAMLRPVLIDCVLSLKPPHCVMTYEDQDSLQRAATVADSGLYGAVDCLLQPMERPPSFSYLRALRVALAIVDQELTDKDEYEVLQEFWKESPCSLETCLVDIFVGLSEEICGHFSVDPPPLLSSEALAHMFRAATETLAILVRLAPNYPLPGRVLRAFTVAATDLFVCTDLADIFFSQSSPACIAAQQVRQSCVGVIRSLAEVPEPQAGAKSHAQAVLRTLLEHGLQSGSHEPAHHMLQVFCLIDYLLDVPDSEQDPVAWGQSVLPNVLRELWAFCRALDTENKAHFVRRLVALDKGNVGIGDWILQEELKDLLHSTRSIQNPGVTQQQILIRQMQISLSLRFLLDLMGGTSSEASWCVTSLATSTDLVELFVSFLHEALVLNLAASQLTKILRTIASESATFRDLLKLPLALALLRTSQRADGSASDVTSSLYLAQSILLACPNHLVLANQVSTEISHLIQRLTSTTYICDGDLPVALVDLLDWFTGTDNPTLVGFTAESFAELSEQLKPGIDEEKQRILTRVRDRLRFTEDLPEIPDARLLPAAIKLSINEIEDLLAPKSPVPSTPPHRALKQDVLSLVTISPPTALIRSSTTGLTKTYSNNDFRQLRQAPSARQNTSRLPSMHVDVGSTS
ncbi:uncharacterized protein PHACADRAFT_170376 [Phanerochaete carnosa HHB-10118-sp]|uniref:Virilizer N-terminal domain-containing protein n=1 Tax=Phanerochaete carnosa (strain HHB-10118-sp) TaxID=650164 RepID=K5XA19_PHACS|nr:uncharacterized protein PHACADRAFT_170376 [Phanerochaete carnosa HHB-10118-sp]EKM59767.1 hypothetical protein PHACADRAFT_170376 [Phanerochaete carnosa HHB-10118-sp]